MTEIPRIAAAVLAAALGAACGARTVSLATPSGPVSVPGGVIRAIEDAWKGAQVSTRAPQCPNGSQASPNPVFAGDFNGDGLGDLVVRLDVDGSPHLFAALARIDGNHSVYDATDGAPAPEGTLSLIKRGTTYRPAGLAVDSYFGQDTLLLTQCDGTRTAYVWSGNGFDAVTLTTQ